MPLTSIYSRAVVARAVKEEGLTAAQAKKIVGDMPSGWLDTLTAYLNSDEFTDGKIDLADLRSKFPTIIPADDAAASFILRLAVTEAGGLAF